MIETTAAELAALFRSHRENRLAAWLDHTLEGDREQLADRIMETFRHGMGGLLDPVLCMNGVYDEKATALRDRLADKLYADAKAELAQILARATWTRHHLRAPATDHRASPIDLRSGPLG